MLRRTPLKPGKPLKSGKGPKGYRAHRRPGNRGMTVAETAYVDAVKRRGCLCCMKLGYVWDDADGEPPCVEAHHVLHAGLRQSHMDVVGLCLWHHKGRLIVPGWSHADHRRNLGPSLAEGATPFEATFGEQTELMAEQALLMQLDGYEVTPITLAL